MNTSFNVVAQNLYDRNFGGTTKGTADPYLSGTFFVKFYNLPAGLADAVKAGEGYANFKDNNEIAQYLQATCLSITVPGGTVSVVEFNGLGGTKWGVPGNIDYGNSITLKFAEMSALPCLAIHHGWCRLIREYRNGISRVQARGPADYKTKDMYACNILYWTTKPDGLSVEYAALYTGCFPLKDPQDLYGGDVTAVDKVEADIEYHVDRIWKEEWVKNKAQDEATRLHQSSLKFRGAQSGTLSSAPDGADSTP